ncbi:hypothetical protein ACFOOK_27250 [Micromonospora krabiensis]|uniref:Uncharacterized protein n=1 Tax=Micromonospora krabiensis TaxID=307121 RepID=A0A1C3N5B4_9ACTN|nr:hypothetical protein [Micromonospora krabiensis]SBV27736.1 hypothetical protein GA0070620_3263 [Micromonospora krabiensis]
MTVVVVLDIDGIVREQQSLMVEVRSADGHLPAAMAAVRRALLGLEATTLDGISSGPAFVSSPIPVPGAQLLVVDLGRLPAEQVLGVPELLVRHLHGAGVRDASVAVTRSGRVGPIGDVGPSARCYLRASLGPPFGDGSAASPWPLLDVALDWLHGTRGPTDQLSALVLGLQVPLTAETARPVAAAVLATLPTATALTVLAGDLTDRLVAATLGVDRALPAATLTVASSDPALADLPGRMRALRDLLRGHASTLLWAGVDAEPDGERVLAPQWSQRPAVDGRPVDRRPGVELLADVLVPDAMWCQILSAGHLARLGGLPPGAMPLPHGRAELTIGEAEQWLPGHPDAPAVRAQGRALLAGCLVTAAQARQMSAARARGSAPPC